MKNKNFSTSDMFLVFEDHADPSIIVATYPELPKILSYIGLASAVISITFLIISIVAANRAHHQLPDSESKTTFMATMSGIWIAISLILLIAMTLFGWATTLHE